MKKFVAVCLLAVFAAGCVSMPVNMGMPANQVEGKDFTVLGEGEGSSLGVMLFNFIPINQNQRFQKAYDEAVASKGGDRLINPVVEERWFWAYLFNGYIFKVKGTVVKDIKSGQAAVGKEGASLVSQ
ncbi:MAG: hypothetical protein FD174_4079 [Geobacteraceae bacterium]|nr:MAG: hypothetical protein FD174_4079 [Geobacteraceae bacterium]